MSVEEELAAALAELGDKPDAIADRLRALGIKGVQGDACRCPVAGFLLSRGFSLPVVGLAAVFVGELDNRTSIPTPAAINGFQKNHDRGVYLDLVATA